MGKKHNSAAKFMRGLPVAHLITPYEYDAGFVTTATKAYIVCGFGCVLRTIFNLH